LPFLASVRGSFTKKGLGFVGSAVRSHAFWKP
jgi:hypothetical protein